MFWPDLWINHSVVEKNIVQTTGANLVIAYFNFVNRVVIGLGVELEEDGGKGYEYD